MSLAEWAAASDVSRARARLDALPDEPRGKRVPLPYADRAPVKKRHDAKQINDAIRAAPVRQVAVEGLHAIQHSVNPDQVLRYLRDPARASTMPGTVPRDVPIVLVDRGKRYLWDGHHRTVARMLEGADSIRARLVDLDAEGDANGGSG
jgi:hypothetical protein